MLYSCLRLLASLFFKILFRFRCYGGKNFPRNGGAILASNHFSYIDPVALGAAAPRPLHFIARHDLFEINRLFTWLLTSVNTFPVRRGGFDRGSVKEAVKRLNNGGVLVIFPEGTRSKDGKLGKGRPGIGLLVCLTGMPVIPAFIKGSDKALSPNSRFIKLHPVSVSFGQPLGFKEISIEKQRRNVYQDISDRVMSEISKLQNNEYGSYID